jgi:hypothetical protein
VKIPVWIKLAVSEPLGVIGGVSRGRFRHWLKILGVTGSGALWRNGG